MISVFPAQSKSSGPQNKNPAIIYSPLFTAYIYVYDSYMNLLSNAKEYILRNVSGVWVNSRRSQPQTQKPGRPIQQMQR